MLIPIRSRTSACFRIRGQLTLMILLSASAIYYKAIYASCMLARGQAEEHVRLFSHPEYYPGL